MIDQYPQQPIAPVAQPKDSTLAIVSLICGIASYFIVPVLGAIAAIIMGHIAKSEIKKSNGMVKGSGMATAGLILGYVQIALVVLSVCALVFLLPAMGASISDIFSDINSSLY